MASRDRCQTPAAETAAAGEETDWVDCASRALQTKIKRDGKGQHWTPRMSSIGGEERRQEGSHGREHGRSGTMRAMRAIEELTCGELL